VPVITTMAVYFIEISRVSWFRQEIQPVSFPLTKIMKFEA
jgi:hypothetical protein